MRIGNDPQHREVGMAWVRRTMVLSGLACIAAAMPLHAVAQQPAQMFAPPAGASELRVDQFVGVWIYNPDESINAATGRPETAPRNGTLRGAPRAVPATASPASPAAPATPRGPDEPSGPAGATPTGAASGMGMAGMMSPSFIERPGQIGPTVAMIQENRSLTRDLLEVPQALTIKVDPAAVTFIDDLSRARSYSTTGEKQKYQLGAARFNALAEWTGPNLQKKIDAADGFRMTEVYYLSNDGQRLFVIVRVGSSRKGAPVMGINRVYDRAD